MMPLTVANVGFHLPSFENFLKSSKHDVRRSPEEMRREHHRVEMLTGERRRIQRGPRRLRIQQSDATSADSILAFEFEVIGVPSKRSAMNSGL